MVLMFANFMIFQPTKYMPLPQARGRKILGCAHGWVITIGEDGEFHILNPLTGIQIALPSMSTFDSVKASPQDLTPQKIRDHFAFKAALSSDPSSSADVVVVVVNLGFGTTCLSFCRPSDGRWKNFVRTKLKEVHYVGKKLYAITGSGSIFACETSPKRRMVKVAKLPHPHVQPLSCYAVECEGEILFIVKRIQTHKRLPDKTISFETNYSFSVYKLNLESGSLVEISSIGDYAMFLGNNKAICLPATSVTRAYKRNSIYFSTADATEWIWLLAEKRIDMVVFSLDDGTIQSHQLSVPKFLFSLPVWVLPNYP